jgi:hypothetical protein
MLLGCQMLEKLFYESCNKMIVLSQRFILAKVSSQLKEHYIFFWAYLVWVLKPMAQKYNFIATSCYRNIVCKNISCELGLKLHFQGWFDVENSYCAAKFHNGYFFTLIGNI